MSSTKKIVILLMISVVCWLAVAGWALAQGRLGSAMDPVYANVFSVTATDADYVYQARSKAQGLPDTLQGAIIPSPQSDSVATAEAFATLKEKMKPKVLVLVTVTDGFGPTVATSYRDWQTAFGIIQISGEIVWEAVECGATINDKAVYQAEALIQTVPYVSLYYPDARIVPLVLNGNAEQKEIKEILENFAALNLDCGFLFITDFRGIRGDLTQVSADTLKTEWLQCADTDYDSTVSAADLMLLKTATDLFDVGGNKLCKVLKPEGNDVNFGNLILYYGQ